MVRSHTAMQLSLVSTRAANVRSLEHCYIAIAHWIVPGLIGETKIKHAKMKYILVES